MKTRSSKGSRIEKRKTFFANGFICEESAQGAGMLGNTFRLRWQNAKEFEREQRHSLQRTKRAIVSELDDASTVHNASP
jgi:hypothetical protein